MIPLKAAVSKTGMQAERWKSGQAAAPADAMGQQLRLALTVASGVFTFVGFVLHVLIAGSVTAALGSEGAGLAHAVPTIVRIVYGAAIVCGAWFVAPKGWFALRRLRRHEPADDDRRGSAP
jgi:Cd2+/Zn2+-exporting ATPase